MKRAIIGCERSGVVRRAFRAMDIDAWSCDLEPADDGDEHHIQADILDVLRAKHRRWDIGIFHPPCTHTAVSGSRWFKYKRIEQAEAIMFFRQLAESYIDKIALEQPVSIISTVYRKPDQIIQPWMFGDMEQKTTCLWLKNLPPLVPTNNVYDAMMKLPKRERERVHHMPPSPERAAMRSKTYEGIAKAMAEQWGSL